MKAKLQGKQRDEGVFHLLNFYSLNPSSGDYSNYLTVQKKMGAWRVMKGRSEKTQLPCENKSFQDVRSVLRGPYSAAGGGGWGLT